MKIDVIMMLSASLEVRGGRGVRGGGGRGAEGGVRGEREREVAREVGAGGRRPRPAGGVRREGGGGGGGGRVRRARRGGRRGGAGRGGARLCQYVEAVDDPEHNVHLRLAKLVARGLVGLEGHRSANVGEVRRAEEQRGDDGEVLGEGSGLGVRLGVG